MFETTQAATATTTHSNYTQLALTVVKVWGLYREAVIGAFVVLAIISLFLLIRRHSYGKWFLLFTLFIGGSIIMLDELKLYVAHQKKVTIVRTLFSPITKPIQGAGSLIKGIFGRKI